MKFRREDVRIDCFRQAIDHWSGSCKATHLPTGEIVQWEDNWRSSGRERKKAMSKLRQIVEASN